MIRAKRPSRPFHLQNRDLIIMRGLFESRMMTLGHAAEIYFAGRRASAQQRLWKLKKQGYVAELERMPSERAVLVLTSKGIRRLKADGALLGYPQMSVPAYARRAIGSGSTRRHELAVMDVKAAVFRAARAILGIAVADFATWPSLLKFRALGAEVRPDAFFTVRETNGEAEAEHSFYMEIDLGSEPLATLALKAARYADHYRSGGFAVERGASRGAYRQFPFRVLFVLPNAERRNNVAEYLLRADRPALSQVWLGTLDDAQADPFGRVWIRPLDYRKATEGTPFAATARRPFRSAARDDFVAKRIERQRLLSCPRP